MNTIQATLLATLFLSAVLAQSQTADEPKELQDLRGSFEKARTAALSPIEKKYVEALTGMKDRLTKRGDLNGALAVDAEINRFKQPTAQTPPDDGKLRLSKFKTKEDFYNWLGTTAWKTSKDNIIRFPEIDEMELTSPAGAQSFYVTTIDKVGEVSWTWSNGLTETMKITPDLNSSAGNVSGEMKRVEP